jgi:hypothetical protein
MAQLFHPATNGVARLSILGGLATLIALAASLVTIHRSPYRTGTFVPRPQPVQFSHRHHVQGLGLDCRYCHTSVEQSAVAGVPATEICMGCHARLWVQAPLLAPVRDSFRTGRPIAWNRVHDLADFAYFDHSIHVAKGVGCETCHGPVDKMPLVWPQRDLFMQWCLDCHRAPERHLRPRDQVFAMRWQPPGDPAQLGRQLAEEYDVHPPTDCSTCHR